MSAEDRKGRTSSKETSPQRLQLISHCSPGDVSEIKQLVCALTKGDVSATAQNFSHVASKMDQKTSGGLTDTSPQRFIRLMETFVSINCGDVAESGKVSMK